MIDVAAVRDRIAAELTARLPDLEATLYPRGVDGAFTSPAVVLGQPSVEFDVAPCSVHRYQLPIAVVVERPGIDDTATQATLEATWPAVGAALGAILDAGALPADVAGARLLRGDPGSLTIHGQGYPAQLLTVELLG